MIERPDFGQSRPFERRHEESKGDFVNVRLNDQERLELQELKEMLRMDSDSTTLKLAVQIARNVLQSTFGKVLLGYLCSARRVRPGPK